MEEKNLLPFRSHFAVIDGQRMHYLDEGSGPVVVLLHGNPTWCFYYRKLVAALRSTHRVIAPDYIGCGLSDHPAHLHYRARDRIRQVEELLKKLAIERFSLVMHDWGGSIGTGVAIERPEAIEKLVFLNTTLTETESLPFIIKRAARPIIGKFLTRTTKHFLKLTTEFGVTRKLEPEVKKGYLYPYRTRVRRTAIWDFVADIPFDSTHPSYEAMLNLAEKIPTLSKIPTLIVWGLRDPCFHREMLSHVIRHFPHAAVCEIPDASHLVLEDAPEIAIPRIEKFLAGDARTEQQRKDAHQSAPQHPLFSRLLDLESKMPSSDAVIEPLFLFDDVRYTHCTYADLLHRVNKYQRGLSELGLLPGDKVVMLVTPGVEFIALSFAIMGRGAIPVFLDPGMGRENILACISSLAPQAFIGSPKAQLLKLFDRDLFQRFKFNITAAPLAFPHTRSLSYMKRFSDKSLPAAGIGDIGLIAFTSGATGRPKAVVFTPTMLEAQIKIFTETFGFEAGKKDLPLLPIFSLFTVACGVCSVFPPINVAAPLKVEPWKIVRVVKDLGISYSFGSPTLWNKIAEYGLRSREDLPTIEKLFIAGAPVSEAVLARVQGLLPKGEAFTPYGSTEALPVTLVSAPQIRNAKRSYGPRGEEGTFVGRAIEGVQVRVVKDEPGSAHSMFPFVDVKVGEIGEVLVAGANVSPSYLVPEAANEGAKFVQNGLRWHRMGDVGYQDSDGNLYFCGRSAHVVTFQGVPYYSVPIERIFNEHPKVRRSALVALRDVSLGNVSEPAIAIEPYPHFFPHTDQEKAAFASELQVLAQKQDLTRVITKFYFHPSFPVDARHNAKIFRDQLGLWASTQKRRAAA